MCAVRERVDCVVCAELRAGAWETARSPGGVCESVLVRPPPFPVGVRVRSSQLKKIIIIYTSCTRAKQIFASRSAVFMKSTRSTPAKLRALPPSHLKRLSGIEY